MNDNHNKIKLLWSGKQNAWIAQQKGSQEGRGDTPINALIAMAVANQGDDVCRITITD